MTTKCSQKFTSFPTPQFYLNQASYGLLKWGVSFPWSFGPNSALGNIEPTTVENTHPTLEKILKMIQFNPILTPNSEIKISVNNPIHTDLSKLAEAI